LNHRLFGYDFRLIRLILHSIREVFRAVGLHASGNGKIVRIVSLFLGGNSKVVRIVSLFLSRDSKIVRISTPSVYLPQCQCTEYRKRKGEPSHPESSSGCSAHCFISGGFSFLLGATLLKLAFYIADAPYAAHWWGFRPPYLGCGLCAVVCVWQAPAPNPGRGQAYHGCRQR